MFKTGREYNRRLVTWVDALVCTRFPFKNVGSMVLVEPREFIKMYSILGL